MSNQETLWVLRAQCDDREALEMLLRQVQPSLRRYLTGLDIGAETAGEIALSILAEAVAVKAGRRGESLKERR